MARCAWDRSERVTVILCAELIILVSRKLKTNWLFYVSPIREVKKRDDIALLFYLCIGTFIISHFILIIPYSNNF